MNPKTVLIAGADNGIGLEMTRTLLAEGYRVAALDLSTENLEAAGDEAIHVLIDQME